MEINTFHYNMKTEEEIPAANARRKQKTETREVSVWWSSDLPAALLLLRQGESRRVLHQYDGKRKVKNVGNVA